MVSIQSLRFSRCGWIKFDIKIAVMFEMQDRFEESNKAIKT